MSSFSYFILLIATTAATQFGCWSDKSARFDEDCLVAYTALVLDNTKHSHQYAFFPNYVESRWYGDCRANIRGENRWYLVSDLLNNADVLIARCQNGFFRFEDGSLDVNVQGRAIPKRSLDAEPDVMNHNLEDTIFNWTTPDPDSTFLQALAPDMLSRRQSDFGPPGPTIATGSAGGLGNLRLVRSSTGIWRLHDIGVALWEITFRTIDMVNAARNNAGNELQVTGFNAQSNGVSTAVVMGMELGDGTPFQSWSQLLGASNEVPNVIGDMWRNAIQDFTGNLFLSGFYHVVNDDGDIVVSFVLNAVRGVWDALPAK